MAQTFHARNNYFIKKGFQTKFIVQFLALIILEALCIVGLLVFISKGTLTTAYYGTHLEVERTWTFFLGRFVGITLVVAAVNILAGWEVLLQLTHRIAGPLFRFEETLEELSKGDVSRRVHLRDSDQLENIQPKMNKALENLDERMLVMKEGRPGK